MLKKVRKAFLSVFFSLPYSSPLSEPLFREGSGFLGQHPSLALASRVQEPESCLFCSHLRRGALCLVS